LDSTVSAIARPAVLFPRRSDLSLDDRLSLYPDVVPTILIEQQWAPRAS